MDGEISPENRTNLPPAELEFTSTPALPTLARLERLYGGIQAGVAAFGVSLLWMGFVSNWEGRSFWTIPNIMAGLFHGISSFRPYFHIHTWSGLAIHLLFTVGFASLASQAIPPRSRLLPSLTLGILFSTGCFYFLDGFFWRNFFAPFAIYSKRPSIFFAYVLIGICVGLYSIFVRSDRTP